jgi:mono/diheme cytochrome c family protein
MRKAGQRPGRGLLTVIALTVMLGQPVLSVAQEESPQLAWGKEIFLTRCASCHGEDGKGDGPAAAALKIPPSDLTKISKNNGGTFPRTAVMNFIDGERPVPAHGPRHMPVWGEVFRSEKADSEARMRLFSLTVFIESIQEQ